MKLKFELVGGSAREHRVEFEDGIRLQFTPDEWEVLLSTFVGRKPNLGKETEVQADAGVVWKIVCAFLGPTFTEKQVEAAFSEVAVAAAMTKEIDQLKEKGLLVDAPKGMLRLTAKGRSLGAQVSPRRPSRRSRA